MKRLYSERSDEAEEGAQKRNKTLEHKWQPPNMFRDMPCVIANEIREFHMLKVFVSQPQPQALA